MDKFIELKLNSNIIKGLELQGINEPTEIQEKIIPYILENKDVIGESYTGSGKTLAYLCPLFEKINSEKREMQAIILAPTHELVMQIEDQIKLLSQNSDMGITSLPIIGDVNIEKQITKIKKEKPHIIVGSAGRILDLIRKKKITSHTIKTIVIDEADNLLDKNNSKVVLEIIKSTMRDRQLMAFSATISVKTIGVLKDIMKDYIMIKTNKNASLNPNIDHMYVEGDRRDKFEILRKLIAAVEPDKAMIFINNRVEQDLITEKLNYHNRPCFNMSSRISKEQRQKALENFKSGKIKFLVSSDISARGLDIQNISHIFNLDFPVSANDYLHRAGRTARGNSKGVAISVATGKDLAAIRVYEREFNIRIKKHSLYKGKLIEG